MMRSPKAQAVTAPNRAIRPSAPSCSCSRSAAGASTAAVEALRVSLGLGAMGLFLPAMEQLSEQGRWQVFIAPPYIPYAPLLAAARMTAAQTERTDALARQLVQGLREGPQAGGRAGRVQNLMQEYALSSEEGVALMCLAEALLRIPDAATRHALIRDKIGQGDWQQHVGRSPSLFVNAASWGLLLTGKLVATHSEGAMLSSLTRMGKSKHASQKTCAVNIVRAGVGRGGEWVRAGAPSRRSSAERSARPSSGSNAVTGTSASPSSPTPSRFRSSRRPAR